MPSYQLAISNIAWQKDDDETVYAAVQQARSEEHTSELQSPS